MVVVLLHLLVWIGGVTIGGVTIGCSSCADSVCGGCSSSIDVGAIPLIRSIFTGNSLETISVLIGLVNTIFAVTLSIVLSVRVVVSDSLPELLAANGVGDEDVFNKVPLAEYTFITPLTKSFTTIGSCVA